MFFDKPNFYFELYNWYNANKRSLPWRLTSDAYAIWVSEVILQQTQVKQGLPYFESFIIAFPTVVDLANASEDEVLAKWKGLGYYSRARNMHKAAQKVVEFMDGIFPISYNELLNLPGIGTYTAAAVASFSSNEPVAVLDGNVFRVLARLYGISTPINTSQGKKKFQVVIDELFDKDNSAQFNQAIMEFGALHCTPSNPNCNQCPFKINCIAYINKEISSFPVKIKANERRSRFLNFYFITNDSSFIATKRFGKDIWKNLYQLPLIERDVNGSIVSKDPFFGDDFFINMFNHSQLASSVTHLLSHQHLTINFYTLMVNSNSFYDFVKCINENYYIIHFADIKHVAFPIPITRFLDQVASFE